MLTHEDLDKFCNMQRQIIQEGHRVFSAAAKMGLSPKKLHERYGVPEGSVAKLLHAHMDVGDAIQILRYELNDGPSQPERTQLPKSLEGWSI